MANLDFDLTDEPELGESVKDFAQRKAQLNYLAARDEDPQKIARANEIGESSGVPPAVVNTDLDYFEQKHFDDLATQVIKNNKSLQEYFTDPMSAKISHRDVGPLDKASESLEKFSRDLSQPSSYEQWAYAERRGGAPAFERFWKGVAERPLVTTDAEGKPTGGLAVSFERALYGASSRVPGELESTLSKPIMWQLSQRILGGVEVGADLQSRFFEGLLAMGHEKLSNMFGEQFANDVTGYAQAEMGGRGDIGVREFGGGVSWKRAKETIIDRGLTPEKWAEIEREGVPRPREEPTFEEAERPGERLYVSPERPRTPEEIQAALEKHADTLREAFHGQQVATIFGEAGEEVPPNVDPMVDRAKETEIKQDLDNLDEVLTDTDATETKELSAKHAARFAGIHGEGEVGISIDKIREVYGDDVSKAKAGDELLGWIPDLANRTANAEGITDEIWVPRSEFVANVKRPLGNQLRDGLRLRDGGVTVDETKMKAEPKQVVAEPLAAVRGGAGMEPLTMAGDRKVTLQEINPKETLSWAERNLQSSHDVAIMDESGNQVGTINLTFERTKKRLFIDDIQAGREHNQFYEPNFLGPALIRDVKRQLKAMFPGAETTTGFRSTGARWRGKRETGERPPEGTEFHPEVKLRPDDDPQPFRDLLQQYWEPVSHGIEVARGAVEQSVHDAIMAEAERMAPTAGVEVVRRIRDPRVGGARGMYFPNLASAFVATEAHIPGIVPGEGPGARVGTLRHELMHFLRDRGYIRDEEWRELEAQSAAEDWRKKFNVDEIWRGFPEAKKDEEAIVEAYRSWRGGRLVLKDDGVFQKIKDFAESVLRRFKMMTGKDLTWEEIFKEIESGRLGRRPEIEPKAEAGEALAMPEGPSPKEKELVAKRNKDDAEAEVKRRLEIKKRTEAPEAKTRLQQIRHEVTLEMKAHPSLKTDKLLTDEMFKIDPKYLSKEQRERLPADYQAKGGVNPDSVAGLVGFNSGDALVKRVAMMTEERKRLGLSQKEYFDKVRDEEVDRRVTREYGDTMAEALDEARDHALGETQMQLAHEQTNQAARAVGIDPQVTLDNMKAAAKRIMGEMPLREIKSSRFLQKAGTLMKEIQDAKVKGQDYKVYRLLQQHQVMQLLTKEARTYEKMRKTFDKMGDQFAKLPTAETAKTMDIPTYNWIQDIYARLGWTVDRAELNRRIGMEEHKNLKDFAAARYADGREVRVPQWIADDPTWPGSKGVDDLTHSEFKAVNEMITAMRTEGRDDKFLRSQGKEISFEEGMDDLVKRIEEIKALKPKARDIRAKPTVEIKRKGKVAVWAHITPEMMWDRMDQGDPYGPFHRLLTYVASDAVNKKMELIEKYGAAFKELKGFEKMGKNVENTIWKDPRSGQMVVMDRTNALGAVAHWGNDSNRAKVTEGWKVDRAAAEDWFRKNTTVEDWDAFQELGDKIHEKLFDEADKMSMEVAGVPIEMVPLEGFTDPFGKARRGWYSPIDYDPYLVRGSKALSGENAVMERAGSYRATTPQGYTKGRTDYKGYVALDLDIIEQRLNQVIHDIATRPALIQLKKILYNQKFKDAVTSRYGEAQYDQMTGWLKQFAGMQDRLPVTEATYNQIIGYFRRNVVANVAGLTASTVMKHIPTAGIGSIMKTGPYNFLKATVDLFNKDPQETARNFKLMWDEAPPIRARFSNMADIVKGESGQAFKFHEGTPEWFRELHMKIGFAPVSIGDFLTVPSVYWAERQKALRMNGGNLPEAIQVGLAAVREAHGSADIMSQPGVTQTRNEVAKFYTSLYQMMSHFGQNMYKTGWKTRDLWNGQKPMDIEGSAVPHMMGKFFTYYIAVAAIEQLVSPYQGHEKDSWPLMMAKSLALGWTAVIPGLREFVRGMIEPRAEGGLIDTMEKFPKELLHTLEQPSSKENRAKIMNYAISTMGLLYAGNQGEARMAEYVTRYVNGLERPKSFGSVWEGITHGKTKPGQQKSPGLGEWWDHVVQGKQVYPPR